MKRSEEERRSDGPGGAGLAATVGLVVYAGVACLGLFIDSGISNPFLLLWLAGFVGLLLTLSYVSHASPRPFNAFPFLILGVIGLNLLVQVNGGAHSFPWSVYFVYTALVAAFSRPLRTIAVTGLILLIETANLIVPKQQEPHWTSFGGFALSLVCVAGAVAFFRSRERKAHEQHDRLVAHATSIDPLSDEARLTTLTQERRDAANVGAALERENAFEAFADFMDGFVKAHTYALYLQERVHGGEALVLRALRSPSRGRAAKIGDALPIGTDSSAQQNIVAACAREKREHSSGELAFPAMNLGYYTAEVPVRSYFALPVTDGKAVIGVLAVDSLDEDAFPEEVRDILARSAPTFVQLIRSIQTSQELDIRASYFRALHKMSAVLNTSLELGDILSRLTVQIAELAPYDLCVFVRYDEEAKDALVLHRSGSAAASGASSLLGSAVGSLTNLFGPDGKDGQEDAEERFPVKESGVLSRMLQEQERGRVPPYHFRDFGERGESVGLFGDAIRLTAPVRTLSCWPLTAGNKFIGACFLGSTRPAAFSDLQINVLDTLMNQVAVVMENALLHRQMSERALTDGLTGLLNHRTFMERITAELNRLDREPQPFTLLLLDIDHFKKVNDTYGHPVGDIALRTVAGIIRNSMRNIDIVARYGGEEFAVGLVGADAAGAEQMAERIRKTVEKTQISVDQTVFTCTLSIGAATLKLGKEKKEGLIARADAALYHAKRSGRNRVCLQERLTDAEQEAAAKAAAPAH